MLLRSTFLVCVGLCAGFAGQRPALAANELPAVTDSSAAVVPHWSSWIDQSAFDGISWLTLLTSLGLVVLVLVFARLLRRIILKKTGRIESPQEASRQRLFLKAAARPLTLMIWAYGLYWALSPLYGAFTRADGSNLVWTIARKGADISAAAAMIWFFFNLMTFLDVRLAKWVANGEMRLEKMLAPFLSRLARIFIVILGGILVLQNLTGLEIGPLIASLGIGGLAVALAAKDSIANFFGTLTILFDKPFDVGERIVIDNYDGVVEDVGFRSTRIRTLTGHLVTIPNEKVVSSGLENIGRRPNIRWLANIGITYDTPPEKVMEAVKILREILDDHEGMRPDLPPRATFNGFNDWSLNITVLAWYHPPDWWAYQAWLQGVCLEILRRFKAAGIDFAFPARTLYLANDDRRQLKLQMLQGETSGAPAQADPEDHPA
jgi:MscS family membrane protein